MEAIRVRQIVEHDGEIQVRRLPCEMEQEVGVIVLIGAPPPASRTRLTARQLLQSDLAGMREGLDCPTDFAAESEKLYP